MRPNRAVLLIATAGVLAASVLTACSSSGGGAVSTAGAGGNGIEKKSAADIVAAAGAAAKAATAVHVTGTAAGSGLDLRLSSGSADARLENNGEHIEVLRVGADHFLQGDAAFWTKEASAAAASHLAGKWVKLTAEQSSSYDQFLTIATFFDQFASSEGTLTKGAQVSVGGVKTITVKDSSDQSTVYVSMVDKPLPLEAESTSSDGGSVLFTDWNVPITDITAPPASSVVDLSTLTGG